MQKLLADKLESITVLKLCNVIRLSHRDYILIICNLDYISGGGTHVWNVYYISADGGVPCLALPCLPFLSLPFFFQVFSQIKMDGCDTSPGQTWCFPSSICCLTCSCIKSYRPCSPVEGSWGLSFCSLASLSLLPQSWSCSHSSLLSFLSV